jgi:transcriptional regulator with XRE-family HTH domain
MNLGKAIKLCRTQKNMSQTDLASQADISVSYLSLLERGKRDPNLSTVERISGALKVPVSILVFLAADRDEISDISPQLAEKLSYTALKLIEESAHGTPEL